MSTDSAGGGEGPLPGPGARFGAWLRRHGPETLVGSLLVTVAGTVISALLTSAIGGGDAGGRYGRTAADRRTDSRGRDRVGHARLFRGRM
ncbi:hypothetical protein [Streptomyces camelliae]|uniref:ABC transporter permease n=1 Tax=Streptomyces camelliae TaxID=3004093 RepID=A0ABY7PFT9_9ACTN|nr:hypothetical protein [Streptomyces sp. HUAS 2-6]WBO69519.1 hypothetical protein O1G22_19815 [Streptomyces sp. HUAS 2-6]